MDMTPARLGSGVNPNTLGTLAGSTPGEPRDVDTLLTLLDRIDAEGWQGPTARALMAYVRETIIRLLVIELGVRGGASSQAEAMSATDTWDKHHSDRPLVVPLPPEPARPRDTDTRPHAGPPVLSR